jgi:hypothetical protein
VTVIKKIYPPLDENCIIKKPIDNIELAKQLNRILNPHTLSG